MLVESTHHEKTTFITEIGKFVFCVMPFSLRNALSTFQRLIDEVVKDSGVFTHCYIDDISVFNQTWDEHLNHISDILQNLETEGLTLQL